MGHISVPPYGPAQALFKFFPSKFVGGLRRYDPIAALRLTTGFIISLMLPTITAYFTTPNGSGTVCLLALFQ